MFHWRTVCMDGVKHALVLVSAVLLVSCSGGDGGAVGSGEVLSWSAPVQREGNAVPMALGEIAGYNLYYKTAAGNYDDQPPIYIDDSNNAANVEVRLNAVPVKTGSYLIVVTTVDNDGRESVFSTPELEVTF